MQINVHGRHCEVPDDLRDLAVEKMGHLSRYMSTIEVVKVEFFEEGKGHKPGVANHVHVTVHTPGPVFRSKVNSLDPKAGLDQALKRLERQMKEFKRMRSGKPAHAKPKGPAGLAGEEAAPKGSPGPAEDEAQT